MKRLVKIIFGSEAFRGSAVVALGALLSQSILLFTLPILTRLYDPEAIGILGIFTAATAFLSSVACLRLEIAIPIATTEGVSSKLLQTAIAIAGCFSIAIYATSVILNGILPSSLEKWVLYPYMHFIPLGIWLNGTFIALQYWCIRQRKFLAIAGSRILQTTIGASFQLAAGLFGSGTVGLVLGPIANAATGVGLLLFIKRRIGDGTLFTPNLRSLTSTVKSFKEYPKYSVPEALANAGSIHVPILLISAYVSSEVMGYLSLTILILTAPISLVGTAISQVYAGIGARKMEQGELGEFTSRILILLITVGSGPLIILGANGDTILPYLFGEEWTPAATLLMWFVPAAIAQLITSPISLALHITKNQKKAFRLQGFGISLRTGAVVLVACYSPRDVIMAHAISGALFYAIYLSVVLRTVKLNYSQKIRVAVSFCAIPVWIAFAFGVGSIA